MSSTCHGVDAFFLPIVDQLERLQYQVQDDQNASLAQSAYVQCPPSKTASKAIPMFEVWVAALRVSNIVPPRSVHPLELQRLQVLTSARLTPRLAEVAS